MKTFVFILLSIIGAVESQVIIPEGWQRPKDELFFQEWRKQSKLQYLSLGADLDCDGTVDSAMILESRANNGIGLFVFVKGNDGKYSHIILYESKKDKANIENLTQEQKQQIEKQFKSAYGIDTAGQGMYQTACGKGYYDCEKDEPEEVLLKCIGIDFFLYDSANSFYYWDTIQKKFIHIWISD